MFLHATVKKENIPKHENPKNSPIEPPTEARIELKSNKMYSFFSSCSISLKYRLRTLLLFFWLLILGDV